MDSTKGYSEVSQHVQENWLKDTFNKVVDKLGLGAADKDRVIDAAETKTTEIEKIEAEVQAKLDSAANDKYQNDKIDDIANASDAEAKAKADSAITKKMDTDAAATVNTDAPDNSGAAAATTGNSGAAAGTVTTTNTTANNDNPRPTGEEEGDPYGIATAKLQVNAGQVGAQERLDRGLAELKADQKDWDAEFGSASTDAATNTDAATEPNTTFDSINDAMKADNLKAGDIITIDGKEAEVGETDDGQQFFVHPGSDISIDKPKPPAPQGELSATDTAQTATAATAAGDDEVGDDGMTDVERQAGAGQDPTGGVGGADAAAKAAQGQDNNPNAADGGGAAPSNGSLLGRKLDLKTPNLMKAFNDGGKKAMPAIRNMQTALSRLGFDPNGIDGKYGNGTFKAVQAFQKANGLAVDGQSGPETMKSMKASLDGNFEKNKVTPADTADKAAADTTADTTADNTADNTDAQNKASDAQLIAKGQAAKTDAQNKASDAQLIAKAQPKVGKESYIQMAPDRNASLANFNVSKMKAKYPKPYVDMPQEDGTVHRGYGPLKNLQDFVKNNPKLKAKIIGKPAQQAGAPNAERDAAERSVQTASKDNNMKKAIEESASMNVSMTADNASEVADLMKLLKNAGMDDAKPVGDIMAPPMSPMSMEPPMPSDNMSDFVKMVDRGEKQDLPGDSSCSVCGDSHEEDSCSEEYDAIVDEWDNSPEEEYKDVSAVIPDGNDLHKSKSSHRAAAGGDNAMAVEASIKEQLWAALNEKMTAEGRGRGKKMKLKASRGNEDIKTTEGSRGKKSRGKKSRG